MARRSQFAEILHADALRRSAAHEAFHVIKDMAGPLIERAHAADPAGVGGFHDIEHIVLLMQENRSFDHYFGTLSGVRGFDDPSPAFRQHGFAPGVGETETGYLNPFRLNTTHGTTLDGVAINDPTHDWAPQHQSWNNGAMDRWVTAHIAASGPNNGPATMGYYTRQELPTCLGSPSLLSDRDLCEV